MDDRERPIAPMRSFGGEPRDDFRPPRDDRDRDHFRGGDERRGPPRQFRGRDDREPRDFDRGFNSNRMEEKQRSMREGLCFICKIKGHMAKDCPQNNGSMPTRGGPSERP